MMSYECTYILYIIFNFKLQGLNLFVTFNSRCFESMLSTIIRRFSFSIAGVKTEQGMTSSKRGISEVAMLII